MTWVEGSTDIQIPLGVWATVDVTNTEGEVSLLENTDFCGDMMFELQALMTKLNFEDRKSSRETRLKEEEAFREALARSVAAMRDEATARMRAAVYNGIGQLLNGTGTALGGAHGKPGITGNATIGSLITLGSGLGQMATTILAGSAEAEAKGAQSLSEEAKADQGVAERAIDDARDAASDAQDAFRKTIERFEEIIMAEEKAVQAAIRG
jgi:hypothetical protein